MASYILQNHQIYCIIKNKEGNTTMIWKQEYFTTAKQNNTTTLDINITAFKINQSINQSIYLFTYR